MRSQVVAIVAGYWRKGLTREEIAKKLGLGQRFTDELCTYLAQTEGHHRQRQVAGRSASGSAGTAGVSSERSERPRRG